MNAGGTAPTAVARCTACGESNPPRFRFCGACGAPLQRSPERRKVATILFCDMVGSTALSEQLDPEAVRELQARLFDRLRQVIEHHGGTVEKFIGDAVMAVFGVPMAHEDDALRAVHAAAEIHHEVASLADEVEPRVGRLAVRIGVNTGEVVAGDASLRQHLVSGDAVNVAARLEQHAEPGQTLIGPLTQRLIAHAIRTEPAGAVAAKGKAEPISAFTPSADVIPGPLREPAGVMVGRETELAVLANALRRATETRTTTLLTLTGEAGIGKSRLVGELAAGAGRGAHFLRGRCLPYGRGITWWPIGEIVRAAAGLGEVESPDAAVERIASLLEDGAEGPEQRRLAAVRVAQAIGLRGGSASADEVAWGVRRLLHALARRRPTVVVVEDLQWAEPPLLDLVSGLPQFGNGSALLVLAVARPELLERRPEWHVDIRLEPLNTSELSELIAERLGGPPDRRLRDHVAGVSGGNPLFVEELVAALADAEMIRREDGRLRASEPRGLPTPPSIEALLTARLDRLDDAQRSVLEIGSVEGEQFHLKAVLALAPPVGGGVTEQIGELVASDLIRPVDRQTTSDPVYTFRHLLLRDAAYKAIPKRRRAELHSAFASWMETVEARRSGLHAAVIGFHLETAYHALLELGERGPSLDGLRGRAASRLADAGRDSFAHGDMGAAASLLGRATELSSPAAEAALLHDLAAALGFTGEMDEGHRRLTEAIAAADSSGLAAQAMKSRLLQLAFRRRTEPEGVGDEALLLAADAIRLFERERDAAGLTLAWATLTAVHNDRGQTAATIEETEKALEASEGGADPFRRSQLFGMLLLSMCFGAPTVDEIVRRCRAILADEARRGPEVVSLMSLRGDVWTLQAWAEALRGRVGVARRLYRRADELYRQLGSDWDLAGWLPLFSARVELLAGSPLAAERIVRAGLRELERMGVRSQTASALHLLAQALYAQDRFDEALEVTRRIQRIAASDDLEPQIGWRSVQAKILARRGQAEDALAWSDEALEIVGQTDWTLMRADTLVDRAKALRRIGLAKEAASAARAAAEIYEQKGATVGLRHAHQVLAALPR